MIYVAHNGQKRPLFSTDRILIPGQHNVENYLAAIAAVQGMVSDEVILHTAETFPGVEHRIELVRTKDGVRYYNDSIASSPTSNHCGPAVVPSKSDSHCRGIRQEDSLRRTGEGGPGPRKDPGPHRPHRGENPPRQWSRQRGIRRATRPSLWRTISSRRCWPLPKQPRRGMW